jgi:sulfur relay (sulfurtransferase) DsrF/TusC family protein
MGKHVVVVIRRTPFNSERTSEALRMAVGLTTGDHKVTVAFLEDSVLTLGNVRADIIGADDVGKHLEACRMLGVRLVADEEALQGHAVGQPATLAEPAPFAELSRLLSDADVVIPF